MVIRRFAQAGMVILTLIASHVMAQNNGGIGALDAGVNSLKPNTGHGICTAAINSDGTVAGGQNIARSKTGRLGVGEYEVAFFGPCKDVRASKGFMRFVQADTLGTGSYLGITCTTADRFEKPGSVFVQCSNNEGLTVDVSFMLMVTR